MTDISFPLWIAAAFLLPRILLDVVKVPRRAAGAFLLGLVGVALAGWYFDLTIMVPDAIGKPVSITVMGCVAVISAWQAGQALTALSAQSRAAQAKDVRPK